MSPDWRTGVYLGTGGVLDDPAYHRGLRDAIGLNTAVLSFSGALPQALVDASPFPQRQPSDAQLAGMVLRHMDGQPVDPREYERARGQVGPGIGAGDDVAFRRAVDRLHADGLEVWLCGGSWTIRRLMFCPSRPEVTAWFEAACAHWASAYGVDGIDLTHARFPMGSFPLGLFSCACDHCRQAAGELGYDMDEMVAALRATRRRLQSLDGARLGEVARLGIGFFDVLQGLGAGRGLVDWLRFRVDLLARALTTFRAAARSANGEILFGSDTFPASMSLTVGHDHLRWAEFGDFASPLVSHISAFTCDTLTVWARFLMQEVPGLTEADALAVIYRFTGYDGMGLPESFDGFGPENAADLAYRVPVADLVLRDLAKARLFLPREVPCYPIIHGAGWPRPAIDRIVSEMKRLGHDGVIWQGTDELTSGKPG